MAKKTTVTTVKEFEYSDDGYLLKETVTESTVQEDEPTFSKGGWYPTPSKPLQIWNDHQHLYNPHVWSNSVLPCSISQDSASGRERAYL